jgi:hypothetical protein
MSNRKPITPRTVPDKAEHPRYALRKRHNAYALYRNGRLHGLDAAFVSAAHDRIAVEYTVATRPGEGRVYHEIPAALIAVEVAGAA